MIYNLEDRRIDDVIIKIARLSLPGQAMLDSNLILRDSLNQSNSLLSIATNQFASFCIDNRSCQSAIFMSVKVAKFEIKRLFFCMF